MDFKLNNFPTGLSGLEALEGSGLIVSLITSLRDVFQWHTGEDVELVKQKQTDVFKSHGTSTNVITSNTLKVRNMRRIYNFLMIDGNCNAFLKCNNARNTFQASKLRT